MPRRTGRWLPATVLVVFVTAFVGVALGHRLDPTARAGAAAAWTQFCDPSRPAAPVGAAVPAFTAVDQDGVTVTADELHGVPWISDFIFTTCTASCPVLTARLVALQHRLRDRRVRFVSFSVDPEHDRPAVLKAYQARWQGEPGRWRLLSTDRNTLSRLGVALGGAEDPREATSTFHSDHFALVDGAGRLLGLYASSSDAEVDRLVRDLDATTSVAP